MSEPKTSPKFNIKELLRVSVWAVKFYYKSYPYRTTFMILLRIISDVKPLAYSFIMAKIIDQLVQTAKSPNPNIANLYPWMAFLFIYYILMNTVISNLQNYVTRSTRIMSRIYLNKTMYEKLNYLGVQTLEQPDVANRIQRSQYWMYSGYDMLFEITSLISSFINAILAGIILFSFSAWLSPVIIILAIIKFIPERYFTKRDFKWTADNTEDLRVADISSYYLQRPSYLQEVSITGAYKFLADKYESIYTKYIKGGMQIRKERMLTNGGFDVVDTILSLIGYSIIFKNFLGAKITIGTVSFQMRALDTFADSVSNFLSSASYINEFSVNILDLVILFEMEPSVKDGDVILPRLTEPPEIEFRNVSFKYPNSDKLIFENMNLKIAKGERVAIVGHNGAGKTTLIKLISRIYGVTSGEILINGININDLKLDDWYKNIGVLFQDYNFYSQLTASENIYIGDPMHPLNDDLLLAASKNADADTFIKDYKHGYEQIMSEQFKEGTRPSTGQQQKIAIARFFYRDAPLAIFDEPTAAIDAVSEYNIFNKIYEFFNKKTVIIISHRFSTVRNAHRIIVMDQGKIVEEGTHEHLLAKERVYSHAFKLQAEGYQN